MAGSDVCACMHALRFGSVLVGSRPLCYRLVCLVLVIDAASTDSHRALLALLLAGDIVDQGGQQQPYHACLVFSEF
jgi:hypothetical protein